MNNHKSGQEAIPGRILLFASMFLPIQKLFLGNRPVVFLKSLDVLLNEPNNLPVDGASPILGNIVDLQQHPFFQTQRKPFHSYGPSPPEGKDTSFSVPCVGNGYTVYPKKNMESKNPRPENRSLTGEIAFDFSFPSVFPGPQSARTGRTAPWPVPVRKPEAWWGPDGCWCPWGPCRRDRWRRRR